MDGELAPRFFAHQAKLDCATSSLMTRSCLRDIQVSLPTIFTFPPNLPLAKGGFATQNNPVTHKGMMFCATFKPLSRYKKGVISITPFFVAERDKCVTHPLNPPPVRGTLLRRTNRSKLYTTESPYKKKRVDYNRNRELAPNILASECGRYNAQ